MCSVAMDGCLGQPAQRASSVAGVGECRWPWAGHDRAYREQVMGVAEPRGAGERGAGTGNGRSWYCVSTPGRGEGGGHQSAWLPHRRQARSKETA